MDVVALLAMFVLSMGLGLAVAHIVLGAVLFFMMRSTLAIALSTPRLGEV